MLDVGGEFFFEVGGWCDCFLLVLFVYHGVGGFLAFPFPLRWIPIYSHLFELNPYLDLVSCSPLPSQNLDVD